MNNNSNIKRPFFSIIIPCYNSKPEQITALFDSIVNQNIPQDIEVIISNDRSTETEFLSTIDSYSSILNIKTTTVPGDLMHCPGNTRETGVSIATGQWITFVDHDDELVPDTFIKIKEAIIEQQEQYIASANFLEVNPYNNGEVLNEFIHTGNWMHGKFYNLDNFWKANNFHFKSDLRTHEDIYISSKTICELHRLNRECPFYIDIFCLKWNAWEDSTSRLLYGKRGFLEQFFSDYAESTIGYYIEDFIYSVNELNDTTEENLYNHIRSCIDVLMYMYFYIQGFRFNNPTTYIQENEFLAKSYVRKICELFSMDTSFIYACIIQNQGEWYNNVRKSAMIGSGTFVESYSFWDFLNN